MELTPARVESERTWVDDRATVVVPLINRLRENLGEVFETAVDPVTPEQYHEAVTAVFAVGDRAVNVAALVGLLRDLDVEGDYPGFVVDELLGRELAATIAGEQPRASLAEATFHYADIRTHGSDEDNAGLDDLDAALAAGFQTRLPGWEWTATESPFGIDPE
ncbi:MULTISPECIES: hypothetical protein [unclassified Halorhabdus]|uniref:hypothetical protein n=1 Tax=unclassified Halorhabdus TaxID=2621901 RepID=UPI0023DC5AE2|nr:MULTISPECIES: hypothetical protein [unclassified Halorhabdus]WEL18044.1 Uncharacterized protein SVXHr_1882 [Halorhabdus sp. SVX81]WEL21925.1 Uncharacterized protein HBNXHr_1869 [Halorhabdus sp. BNX81]